MVREVNSLTIRIIEEMSEICHLTGTRNHHSLNINTNLNYSTKFLERISKNDHVCQFSQIKALRIIVTNSDLS
jgi:hypothetical protein